MAEVPTSAGSIIFENGEYWRVGEDGMHYYSEAPPAGSTFWSGGEYWKLGNDGQHYWTTEAYVGGEKKEWNAEVVEYNPGLIENLRSFSSEIASSQSQQKILDTIKNWKNDYDSWLASIENKNAQDWAQFLLKSQGIDPSAPQYADRMQAETERMKRINQQAQEDVMGLSGGVKVARGIIGAVEGSSKAANIAVRQAYVDEVRGLSNLEQTLRAEGKSVEEIAVTLQNARRELGIKYKEMTSPEMLDVIYKRNMEKYGNELGPTIDYLRSRGKTWEEIIESAKTPGKEFNELAGIK